MFSVEFGKIYRIFLISSVSELFGNSSWINFFRVALGYITRLWKKTKNVFISKPGCNDYDQAGSFSHISLAFASIENNEKANK